MSETQESESRRLKTKLAEIGDRSDLELMILYPKKDRAAEDAELAAVEAELEKKR